MNDTARLHRCGITFIQVIIVLVLVLLGVGVAIVAVRGWWDRSYQAHCMFHLKQLGVGIAAYQDKKKSLPPSVIAQGYATWAVCLAPYLPEEANGPLAKWDLRATYYEQSQAIRQAQQNLFYCPARRAPPQNSIAGDVPRDGKPEMKLFSGALGDYACSLGDALSDEPNGAIIPARVVKEHDGMILKWQSLTSLEALPRGESHTILLGEKHVPWQQFGLVSSGDGSVYNGDYPESSARVCGPKFGLAQSISEKFHDNFGSYHPGICQFLMADGSVRSFDLSLNPEVLGKLTNRHN